MEWFLDFCVENFLSIEWDIIACILNSCYLLSWIETYYGLWILTDYILHLGIFSFAGSWQASLIKKVYILQI